MRQDVNTYIYVAPLSAVVAWARKIKIKRFFAVCFSISRLLHIDWLFLSLPERKPGQTAFSSYPLSRATVTRPQLSRASWGKHGTNVSSKGFLFRALYPKNVSPFAPFLELPLLSCAYNLYFFFSSMRLCLHFLLPCAPSFHYAPILIGWLLLSRVTVVNSPEEFLNWGKVIWFHNCLWVTSRVLLIYSYTNYISIYIWEYSTYVFCPPLI